MSAAQARPITVRTRAVGFLGLAVMALTAACSSTPIAEGPAPTAPVSAAAPTMPSPGLTTTAPPADVPTATLVPITINAFAFEVPQTVPAGATVTVVNEDPMSHTVTSSVPGAFDVTVVGGATITFVAPAAAGSYDFVCSFHGNMKGTLVVT